MTDAGQNLKSSASGTENTGQPSAESGQPDRENSVARSVRASLQAAESIWADEGAPADGLSASSASMLGLPILDEPVLTGTFGSFQITRCLGRTRSHGSYLATDSRGEKPVVLKTVRFSPDASAAAAAFHETAKLVSQIEHRNLCPVFEDGDIDGTHFFARRYVEGQPLADLMHSPKAPPAKQVAMLVRKIAVGLLEAHRRGVIHGALTPSNIIIDVQREPNLTDFRGGLARDQVLKPSSEASVAFQESFDYRAPEQSDGKLGPVGPQTDLYSLGVILFELLTGRRPFVGSPEEVAAQKLANDPQMPSKLRSGLHPSIDLICLRLLMRQPNRRYASVEQSIVALDDFLQISGAGSTQSELIMMADFYRACDTFDARDTEMEKHRRRIDELLAEHKYGAAEKLLLKITTFQDPALSDFANWAKKQLPGVRAMPQKMRAEAVAAYRVAVEMVDHFEYDQAAKLLRGIHPKFLDDRTAELLRNSIRWSEEVELLSMGLDVAEEANRLKNMGPQIERLLELKPNHQKALRIRREIKGLSQRGASVAVSARPGRSREKPTNKTFAIIIGILGIVMLAMAVTLLLRVDWEHGTIAVGIDNPRTTVLIDGTPIAKSLLDKPLRLTRGTHQLVVIRDDGKQFQREFEVGWGKNRPLQIEVGGRR